MGREKMKMPKKIDKNAILIVASACGRGMVDMFVLTATPAVSPSYIACTKY